MIYAERINGLKTIDKWKCENKTIKEVINDLQEMGFKVSYDKFNDCYLVNNDIILYEIK